MIILLLVVCIVLIFYGVTMSMKKDPRNLNGYDAIVFLGFLGAAVSVIVAIVLGVNLFTIDRIKPAQVAYLQENNAEIESKLSAAVESYQAYEQETYAVFKPNPDADITLSVPPALQSNTLVASLLETYTANNATIRQLRLDLLSRPAYAFWLYFGG